MGSYGSHYGQPQPAEPRRPFGPQPVTGGYGAPPGPSAPPHRRRRRRRRGSGPIVVLASVVVLGLILVSLAVVRPGPVDAWLGGARPDPSPVASAALPPPPVLAAAGNAPAPSEAGIKAVLDPLAADTRLGGRVSISVTDVATGQVLYAHDPDTSATPASTTKLVTAVTALTARGGAYRIATRAVAGATPGEVVLVGGGDPALSAGPTGSYPGAARLDQLAEQVKKALGGTAPTKVVVDSTLFTGPAYGPSWDADIASGGYGAATTALMTDGGRVDPKDTKDPSQRYQRPDLAAGQAFARALGLPVSAVVAGKAPAPAGTSGTASGSPTISPGVQLGQVESPPLARLVEIMLTESDNVVAEVLARHVALAKGQPASYAGAAAAMNAVLAELGLPATESGLVDGSGLSRANRLTPSLLTDILNLAARADRPNLHPIFSGLPVAGYSGTLRDRYRSPGPSRPGAGLVRAKTGTLSGVNAISGIAVTQEGRVLAFAALADRTTAPLAAQEALDRFAAALAACGCR